MKKIVWLIALLIGHQAPTIAAPNQKAEKFFEVAIISSMNATDFQAQLLPIVQEHFRNCQACRVVNLTPYQEAGAVDETKIPQVIAQARSSAGFLYMHWNVRMTEDRKLIVEELKKSLDNGFLVIGAAGLAAPHEPTLPLNKTVLGSVPGLIIVGDLEARERLPTRSYFGPEMLTAVRTPEALNGKGLGSAIFVGRLASSFHRRSGGKEWQDHLLSTKAKTRRLWPSLDEFFGR